MKPAGGRLLKLEAVRGLAALYVFIAHAAHSDALIWKFGQEAVMVFFLLSGFVIETTYQRDPSISFGRYFAKRWLRIYPVLLLLFALVAVVGHHDSEMPNYWQVLLGNLFMLQDFDVGKPHVIVPTLYAPALWSLHYEWWFYMLFFPFRRYLRPERGTLAVALLSLTAGFVYLFFPYAAPRLLMYFITWWLGVTMAQSYHQHGVVRARDLATGFAATVAISALLLAGVWRWRETGQPLLFGTHPVLELRHFAAVILTVPLALAWQHLRWRGFGILMWGTWIAPISYSLYIAHQPLFAYAEYGTGIESTGLRFALHLVVLLGFCYLAEIKIYPWLQRKLLRRRKTTARTSQNAS